MVPQGVTFPRFDQQVFHQAIARVTAPVEETHYEHRVSSVVSALLQHYFSIQHGWLITPEQRQYLGDKPDFVVEGLDRSTSTGGNPILRPHLFVECKKTKGKDFFAIMDQISKAMEMPAELETETLSFFAIGCRGRFISFYEYYNFRSYLDEEGIPHYEGMVPLTNIPGYPNGDELSRLKVQAISEYHDNGIATHIWDLADPQHRDYIHLLFTHIVKNIPRERYVHRLPYNLITRLNMLQCLDIFSRSL